MLWPWQGSQTQVMGRILMNFVYSLHSTWLHQVNKPFLWIYFLEWSLALVSQLLNTAMEPLSLNAGPERRAGADCALMHLIMGAAAKGSDCHIGRGCQEGDNHYLIRPGLILFFLVGVVGAMPTAPPHWASSALLNPWRASPILLTAPCLHITHIHIHTIKTQVQNNNQTHLF